MESGRLCFVSPFMNLMTHTEKADWFVSMPVREASRAGNAELGKRSKRVLSARSL